MNLFQTTKLNRLNLVVIDVDMNAIFGLISLVTSLVVLFRFQLPDCLWPRGDLLTDKMKKNKKIRCPCQTEMTPHDIWWQTLGFICTHCDDKWHFSFSKKNPKEQLKTPDTLQTLLIDTLSVLCLRLITEICAPRHSPKERLDTQQEVSNSPQINTQSGKAAVLKKCLTETSPPTTLSTIRSPGPAAHSRCLSGLYRGLAALLCSVNGLLLNLINENVSLPIANWGVTARN